MAVVTKWCGICNLVLTVNGRILTPPEQACCEHRLCFWCTTSSVDLHGNKAANDEWKRQHPGVRY